MARAVPSWRPLTSPGRGMHFGKRPFWASTGPLSEKVDNCRTANFKSLVGSREPREVLHLPPSPNPFHSARPSVGRDEPRFQLEFQVCKRAEGCRREVTESVFSFVNGT